MRRFHFIELHEQSWYPQSWREIFQLLLGYGIDFMKPFDNMDGVLRDFFTKVRTENVLDLCSGSGEAALSVWGRSVPFFEEEDRRLKITLSDIYPNLPSYERLEGQHGELIEYYSEVVNAFDPPEGAPRIWSMIESLHHFRPDEVKKILRNATLKADGFVALETTGRTWRHICVIFFFLPLVTALVTAFQLRPWSFRNILWGLLFPVIPLTAVFDGFVSCLRTHTVEELEKLVSSLGNTDFSWQVGTREFSSKGPGRGLRATYLIGWRNMPDETPGRLEE